MADTGVMHAFVVGEVAKEFYGRADLAKYPLGLSECENFIIDYKGGLMSRPGTEFIAALPNQTHQFVKFRSSGDDYLLLFTDMKMRVIRNGGFILTGAGTAGVANGSGTITVANTFSNGQMMYVSAGALSGYYFVTAASGASFKLENAFGDLFVGALTYTPVYERATTFSAAVLETMAFYQDGARVICTDVTIAPTAIAYVSDTNWTIASVGLSLPTPPTGLTATASGTGSASVSYVVTVVVGGVESEISNKAIIASMVNFTSTTGHVALSWAAVAGAEYYNVYRTLVFPNSPFPTGAQYGYLGKTAGTTFTDNNTTADFTKSPPSSVSYFSGANYPALYGRFQQRGIYAGLAQEPLAVVGSMAIERERFAVNSPPIASDSFKYTLDAQSVRPIKYMIPLRYGLMLFTDDGVTQLRGGSDSRVLTAISALAEPQSYVSVADLRPIAINMDLLFVSALNTEINAMLYTEYTNSFKSQDLAVLSSHLFGASNKILIWDWAPEPHKILHMIRQDGQRVTLTYEREQEVFGFSRHRTRGKYLSLCVIREENYNLPYYSVQRRLKGKWVMSIEREKPRYDYGYDRMWYVDAGLERAPTTGVGAGELIQTDQTDNLADWLFYPASGSTAWASAGMRMYVKNGLFSLKTVNADHVVLGPIDPPVVSELYENNRSYVVEGEWSFGTLVSTVSGLWHLEGETVSVLADGDAYLDLIVENGSVSFPNEALRVVVGLPYHARGKTLPLSPAAYQLGKRPAALRGVATRLSRTRGLALGPSYEELEELAASFFEAWGNPRRPYDELVQTDFLGGLGWELDPAVCFEQKYPLPALVLGLIFDIDAGA